MNIALFGGSKEVMRYAPENGEQYIAVFGGVEVDLRHVTMPESINLSALACFGGVKIIVPHGTDVVLRGFAIFGGRDVKRRADSEIRNVVYLNAVAVFGGIEVIEEDA